MIYHPPPSPPPSLRGVGCVIVTYTVGGLSLLNAVAGAASERLPLIVITGVRREREERGDGEGVGRAERPPADWH